MDPHSDSEFKRISPKNDFILCSPIIINQCIITHNNNNNIPNDLNTNKQGKANPLKKKEDSIKKEKPIN